MSNKTKDFHNKKFNNQKPRQGGGAKVAPSAAKGKRQKAKQPTRTLVLSPRTEKLLPVVYYLLFTVLACVYLAGKNCEYLYACQEHSIWQNTRECFDDMMRVVGGFSQWVGCYLTQFFYHPWMGTTILIVLWAFIYALTIKVCGLSRRWSILALAPVVLLLCTEINLGYWLYYIKQPGYWFTYTVAILIMLAGICVCNLFKGYVRAVLIVLYVAGLYPLIGFWSLCGAGYMALQSLVKMREPDKWNMKDMSIYVTFVLALAAYIVIPKLYYQHYTTGRVEDLRTVLLPLFQLDKYIESAKRIPFVVIALIPAILILLQALCKGKKQADDTTETNPQKQRPAVLWLVATVVVAVAYVVLVSSYNFSDKNYHTELKMYHCLSNYDWQGTLDASREAEGPHTRQMIMSQNVALLHLGTVGENMFRYDNRTIAPHVPTYKKSEKKYEADLERYKDKNLNEVMGDLHRDSLKVNLCNTAGALIYFLYGKTNFAYRWCVENGVEFTFRVDEYKNMIRCAMIAGEDKLAAKYIDILRNTTFHKAWAEERLAMLRDKKKYEASEEYKCVKPLYDAYRNALDGDQGLVEMYLISYFCHMNSDDPKFQEATLAFSLIQKDIALFWPRFFKYAELHENEPMPIHYQEAAYLFGDLEHQVDTSKMPFDQLRVKNRYQSFKNATTSLMKHYGGQFKGNEAGLTRKVGEECFGQFGDTYWWFYYFSRGVHTY